VNKIRVLLLDDQTLFHERLARLLATEDEFELVAQCSTREEALFLVDHYAIDLALLDFDLGDDTGLRFIVDASAAGYSGKILLVAAGVSPIDAALLQEQGVSGIFLKHGSPARLLDAIRAVMRGRNWIDAEMENDGPTQADPEEKARTSDLLTPRERQVLRCVFEGLINKQIAARIRVSQSSVKVTLQQLFDKTGVRTRSQLVRFAIERSLEADKNGETPASHKLN
jgi:DNA-binding NarL/FixJ family response regulator